jgi:hypothetical protein
VNATVHSRLLSQKARAINIGVAHHGLLKIVGQTAPVKLRACQRRKVRDDTTTKKKPKRRMPGTAGHS